MILTQTPSPRPDFDLKFFRPDFDLKLTYNFDLKLGRFGVKIGSGRGSKSGWGEWGWGVGVIQTGLAL